MTFLIERFIQDVYLLPHIGTYRKSRIYLFQSLLNLIDRSVIQAYGSSVRRYNEFAESVTDWPAEVEEYPQSHTAKQRAEMTDYEFAENVKMNLLAKIYLDYYLESECEKSNHKNKLCEKCRGEWEGFK